jgi:hypothetical protein
MLSVARCENVVALNTDFLTIDPTDSKYAKVTHMYVFNWSAVTSAVDATEPAFLIPLAAVQA